MTHDPIEEQSIEENSWYQGPMKIIVGIFLLIIIILMSVPYYAIKIDPQPKNIDTEILFFDEDFSRLKNIYEAKLLTTTQTTRINAVKISSENCNDNNNICNAKALFYFTRDKIKYIQDPIQEYIQHPIETLKSKGGDCEDKAILLSNLLKAIGLKTRLVLTFNHAYVEVWIPNAMQKYKNSESWINLDPTCSTCDFGEIPPKYTTESKKYVYLD